MKRWFMVLVAALSMVILFSPCTPQAAEPDCFNYEEGSNVID